MSYVTNSMEHRLLTGTCNKPMWTISALIRTALSNISLTNALISPFSDDPSRTRTSNRSSEFHVWLCTFAARVLMVGLAVATSSTVTTRRPGSETKLNVSLGRDRRASRRRSWYREFFQLVQNPETAGFSASRGEFTRMAMRSLRVAVSTPWRSGQSNASTTLLQSSLTP